MAAVTTRHLTEPAEAPLDQTARHQTAQDQTAQDQTAQDQTVRHQGDHPRAEPLVAGQCLVAGAMGTTCVC